MTMVELALVMGIVSILMALVLGLARHVDAAVKIRRAQVDLGEWHEPITRWYLRFGEYPHARIDTRDDSHDPLDFDWEWHDPSRYPLAVLTNDQENAIGHGCYVRYYTNAHPDGTNVTFRSFLTTDGKTVDPWGTPYIYLPGANGQSYELFSCGPNRQTLINNQRIPTGAEERHLDPTRDDIYFER